MNSFADRALEHAQHLSVQIGSRPIGSPANHAAADYIGGIFQNCGLSTERQEIPCPNWVVEQTSLELNGELLEASTNTFSPSCDVSASIEPVCTPAGLEAAAITGRILELLEQKHPAGIITINPTLHALWRIIEDFDLDIPSVTVSARSGLKLLKAPGAPVWMKITARWFPSHTDNVVARLPGNIPRRFLFRAHYDSKVDTPGTYDNAAGVGVLLTLVEALSHRQALTFTGVGCL